MITSLEQRTQECIEAVGQIEVFVGQQDAGDNLDLNLLTHALKTQYPSFTEAANIVAETHEHVSNLVQQVEVYRSKRYGDSTSYNPFQPAQSRGMSIC